ncbi:MAG: AAA family ATPase [Eggerthellaceae bacterium]|nr:AAA family ATPase [Eggerthellaceae bacterium]
MEPRVVFCMDEACFAHPEMMGLGGERFASQPWLKVFVDAQQARDFARAHAADCSYWIAGSDSVDAINLAAALKRDGASTVALVSFSASGSLYSRARAAGVTGVMDGPSLARIYAQCKARFGSGVRECPGDAKPQRKPAHAAPECLGKDVFAGGGGTPSSGDMPPTAKNGDFGAKTASEKGSPKNVSAAEAFRSAFEVIPGSKAQTAQVARAGFMLGVVGAGGGMGKSTVSVLCALLSARMGYRTVLVDADLQCGDAHFLLGVKDPMRIDDAIAHAGKLDGLRTDGGAPALLAAPLRLEHAEEVEPAMVDLLQALRKRFDVVVVNTAPAWDTLHMRVIALSSAVFFVLDQRPTAIRLCRHALELCSRCGVATRSVKFLVNRCSRSSLFSSIDVSCALSGAHVLEVADGGREVGEVMGSGQAADLVDAGNPACRSLEAALRETLPHGSNAANSDITDPKRKRVRLLDGLRRRAACL